MIGICFSAAAIPVRIQENPAEKRVTLLKKGEDCAIMTEIAKSADIRQKLPEKGEEKVDLEDEKQGFCLKIPLLTRMSPS